MKRTITSFCVAGFILLTGVSLFGQGTVTITGVSEVDDTISITSQNTGAERSASFQIQGVQTVDSVDWMPLPSSIAPVDGQDGLFVATIQKIEGDEMVFYRILGIAGSVDDLDGDGLADSLEPSLLTDPALFDTDGDGFSDGQELAYGTDPLDPSSKPVFVSLPTVNFVAANSTAVEGEPRHQVQILFDRPYSGTVNYAVNSIGNTTAGTDFTLGGSPTDTTGSIPMSGTSAFIPLDVVDDANVSGQRVVILNLTLNGEDYFIGGRASHVVLLEDNDFWWSGTFLPASGDVDGRIFRMNIARHGAGTTVIFGSGAGQDGLPVPEAEAGGGAPAIDATSISSSIIPEGQWPATLNADNAAQFSVDSGELPVPAGSLFGNEMIRRKLLLNAQPALDAPQRSHLLEEIRYVGDYTEILTTSGGAPLATLPGTFLIVRDIPAPLPVLSRLVPPTP